MKFPTEIGTGQFPHVMQFKVFWRWEAKELRDAKAEGEKTLETLSTLKDLIDNGSFNPVGLQASNIDQQTSMALQEVLYNDKLLKTVNPSIDQNLATLLQNDPAGARDLMEKTVESYQYRVSTLATEIDEGGKGAVTLDEDERMLVNSRVGQVLADTSATEAGLKAGALAGASQFAASYLSGKDWKRSAIDAAKTGAGAGAAVAGAILAAQALQNEPKYDQMVSIYLPMCTKTLLVLRWQEYLVP
jgi:hypothetical protein